MQILAKYFFEVKLEENYAESRFEEVDLMVSDWLLEKGVSDLTIERGSFNALGERGDGKFIRALIQNEMGTMREVKLFEIVKDEHAFVTTINAAISDSKVTVFCSLAIVRLSHVIAPIQIYPRCPKIIRLIAQGFGDWLFGGELIPTGDLMLANAESDAIELCKLLLDEKRKFPIVVISSDQDEAVWPTLAEKMARDLVGIAHVAVVNEEGSWVMTDELGKLNSCYLGAVRLYWPLTSQESLRGSVWTATHLLNEFGAGNSGMNRFLSYIRGDLMTTASLSIVAPKCIREISKSEVRNRLRATDAAVREEELNSIIDENSDLSDQLEDASSEIARLKSKISYLHDRLGESELAEEVHNTSHQVPTHIPPEAGEVRFYKKIGKKGDADTLVVTAECNHNASSWKPLFKAIQAEKGIQKLEGRSDWSSVQHCSSCTGGGRWRVHW